MESFSLPLVIYIISALGIAAAVSVAVTLTLMGKLGVDTAKFSQIYQSFSLQSRCRQADQLMKSYDVTSVPTFAVNGRYITSPSMAGGDAQAMQVVDYLLSLPRS